MYPGKFKLIFIAIVFLAFPVHSVWAEEGEMVKLDDIVVSATKTEKRIEDAPGAITVITMEDIKLRSVKTVDEALSEIPGLFVKRTKGLMDSTSSLRLRGFNNDRYTLILVDGLPANDAYTGGIEWGLLPIDNIERIEVVRGAASALYGGNAMGGVINIITRIPEKPECKLGGGYGTHDAYRYRVSAGNRLMEKFSLRVGYEEEGTDGYKTTPVLRSISAGDGNVTGGYPMNNSDGSSGKWVVGDKGENGAEKRSLDLRGVFDFSDTGRLSFSAIAGRHEYDYGRPNTYMGSFGDAGSYAIAGPGEQARFRPNDFISYTGISKNETEIYSLSFSDLYGPVKITGQAGTVMVDDQYTTESGSGLAGYNDSPGKLNNTENSSWFSEIRGDVPLGESHLITLGLSYRSDESDTNSYEVPFYRSFSGKGPSTYYAGGKDRIWALFIQDEWKISGPLTLYIGGRYDSWKVYDGASGDSGAITGYKSNTESEFSPKLAAVFKPFSGTTLRTSVGQAFRAPTLYELYRTWVSWSTTYMSNPELQPETVLAYEAGADQYLFNKKTRLSLTGFWNDIDDLIYERVESTDGATTKTRINTGKARTYGIEAEASQNLFDWFTLWGNYTYTQAKIKKNPTDPDSEDKQITGIPKTAFNVGLDADYKWIKGSLTSRYYSKIYNKSDNSDTEEGVYGSYEPALYVDAKITLSPVKWARLSFSADNIFDEKYYEYYKSDGRTFFCEMSLQY